MLIWICFIYCLFSCIRFVVFVYRLVNKVDRYAPAPASGDSRSQMVWVKVGVPKILRTLGCRPLGLEALRTGKKHATSHVCRHAEFGRCMQNRMGKSRGFRSFSNAGVPSIWDRAWLTPWNTPLSQVRMAYRGEGSKKFKGRWDPPLGMGRGRTVVRPSPTCYLAKCGRSRSNGTSVITEIRRKYLTLHVPPLRSFEIVLTDTNRSAT